MKFNGEILIYDFNEQLELLQLIPQNYHPNFENQNIYNQVNQARNPNYLRGVEGDGHNFTFPVYSEQQMVKQDNKVVKKKKINDHQMDREIFFSSFLAYNHLIIKTSTQIMVKLVGIVMGMDSSVLQELIIQMILKIYTIIINTLQNRALKIRS